MDCDFNQNHEASAVLSNHYNVIETWAIITCKLELSEQV